MGQDLSPADVELYRVVDEALYRAWDPIGISGESAARDEYRSYVPQVFAMVQNGNGIAAIAGFLSYVRVERMELPANDKSDIEVATILLQKRESIYGEAA